MLVAAGGSLVLECLNTYALPVFLAANAATGAVNAAISTYHASDAVAMAVLAVYVAGVCALAVAFAVARARGGRAEVE